MVEEDLMLELKAMAVARLLAMLDEEGELEDFVDFAKEKAKEDGMDSKEFNEFLDNIKEIANKSESTINWRKIILTLKELDLEFQCFKGDNSIMIESKELDPTECLELATNSTSPLNIKRLNDALMDCNVRLEYIEAINCPFDLDGFKNFIRFGVEEI